GGTLRSLCAQGNVDASGNDRRLRGRRLDFDASDQRLVVVGDPTIVEIQDSDTKKPALEIRADQITFHGALGYLEAVGSVQATLPETPRSGATSGGAERELGALLSGGARPEGPVILKCGKLRALVDRNAEGDPVY